MDIIEKIKETREAKGISRYKLSQLTGIHESTLKRYEEFQENQIKALEELVNMNDLDELDGKLEEMVQVFNDESEGLLKEVFYVNRKIFEEASHKIWEKANEKVARGEATNV